jgi:hypothetical protein
MTVERAKTQGSKFYVRGKPHLCRAVLGANSRGSAAVSVNYTPMGNISLLGKNPTCGFPRNPKGIAPPSGALEG